MKFFQALLLSILVMAGGLSCSKKVERRVEKIDWQDYNLPQIKTVERYHRLQTGILAKYYRRQAKGIEMLTGQTEEQRKTLENLRRIQRIIDRQRREEEALLREHYGY